MNYENYIMKNEYEQLFLNILEPHIYEGLQSIQIESRKMDDKFKEKNKSNSDIKSPGVINIFKKNLKDLRRTTRNNIEKETNRIINRSNCPWLENLYKAVIKSTYLTLISSNNENINKIESNINKIYEKYSFVDFIHNCYINCGTIFYNKPKIFFCDDKNIVELVIKNCINKTIKETLPMNDIIESYIKKRSYSKYDKNIEHNKSKSHRYKNSNKYDPNYINRDILVSSNKDSSNVYSTPSYSSSKKNSGSYANGSEDKHSYANGSEGKHTSNYKINISDNNNHRIINDKNYDINKINNKELNYNKKKDLSQIDKYIDNYKPNYKNSNRYNNENNNMNNNNKSKNKYNIINDEKKNDKNNENDSESKIEENENKMDEKDKDNKIDQKDKENKIDGKEIKNKIDEKDNENNKNKNNVIKENNDNINDIIKNI